MGPIKLLALSLATFAGSTCAQFAGYATYSNKYDGVCSGITSGLPLISMNAAQFGGGSACGQCVQVQGTGNGAGSTPVSTSPFIGLINNVCPQCGWGDLELQTSGNGRWGINWSFVACPGWGRKLIEGRQGTLAYNKSDAEALPKVTAGNPAGREESPLPDDDIQLAFAL